MKYLRAFFYFLITLAIYQGIPLLGWGIAWIPSYFESAGRLMTAIIVLLFSLAVGALSIHRPESVQERKGPRKAVISKANTIGLMVIVFLALLMLFLPLACRRNLFKLPDLALFDVLGLFFVAAGYLLIFLSSLYLGKSYSAKVEIQEGQKLVTAGLYKFIRHPRYAGIIMLAFGYSLVFGSWIGLLCSILPAILLNEGIAFEERMMRAEFGQEWEKYASTTKRLIPFLY
jgi:protein-S-isoprenylcysteine O-methyltransferase Ste14